ncbi:MAG: FliG C-terminal domain-containing protein [Pseudomonadota bacterium]
MNELPTLPPMPGGPLPAATPVNLTSKEKAAIVVRLLLSQGAVPALSQLSDTKQTELAVQIARMAPVDQDTVQSVADEFASEIERIALSFPQGLDGALGLLDGVLSEGATNRLRQMAPTESRRKPWDEVEQVEPERLVPYLESESLEVAAVILSKISVGKAAEVLSLIPGDLARRITYAISQTDGVSPGVVHRIGNSLAEELDTRPVTAFAEGPVSRVGAILNYARASVRDDVLTGIESEDKPFADEVRAAIFTFANIPDRISPRDVPRIQRDMDPDDLTLVVAAAEGDDVKSVDFILENISKRMAENIRDEAKEKSGIKPEEAEAAQIRIITVVRELEAAGEIFFVANDD